MSRVPETKLNHLLPTRREGRILVVMPQGDSVGYKSGDIPREIDHVVEAIENHDIDHVVFDLGAASYYGTVVIGAMHDLTKRIEKRGGKAVMCDASDDMKQILKSMNLDSIWMVFDTRNVALKALGK